MRLLLDTHTFLWAVSIPARLSAVAREAIEDPGNELLVSAVTAVELALKVRTNRLQLDADNVATFLRTSTAALGCAELPFTVEHGTYIELVPLYHRDPFDHMLIAQARVEGLPIVTNDGMVARYDVETIW